MKRAGLRAASVSQDTKLDTGRTACKPTETAMFYDRLLAAVISLLRQFPLFVVVYVFQCL